MSYITSTNIRVLPVYKNCIMRPCIQMRLDNGEIEEGGTWTVKNGRIHAADDDGDAFIFELNGDGNLMVIAVENGGNKKHLPKEEQLTFKRIK